MQVFDIEADARRAMDAMLAGGVAIIPTDDIDWAVAELERVSKMGLWGAMINMQPLEGCPPYRAAAYDPLEAGERSSLDLDVDPSLRLA